MQPYYQDEFVQLFNANCFDILPTIEEKVDLFICDLVIFGTYNL
jgi:hypothetical protein